MPSAVYEARRVHVFRVRVAKKIHEGHDRLAAADELDPAHTLASHCEFDLGGRVDDDDE